MFDLKGLKVCFVAGTLGQGGAERQLFYIVKALVENGAHPRVLSLTAGEFWEEPIRALGVPVDFVGKHPSKLARVAAIAAAVRSDRPDVLQSQHFYTNLYVVAAARALGIKEVGAIRCNTTWEVQQLGSVFGGLSLRIPRVVAANSRAAIGNAVALGVPEERFHFLPNVVDTGRFVPGSPHTNGRIRLLAVGRCTRQKRFDRLLSVLAGVRRRSARSATCLLVTTGNEDRQSLQRSVVDNGLDEQVEFREAVSDMAPLYQDADIFLLTSDWEGTPNVVLEAMASGTPVVSTRVGGVPDLVRHGDTGYLADPDDENAFVESVIALMDDSAARLAMGRRARAFVAETHALARLPSMLGELYEMVGA